MWNLYNRVPVSIRCSETTDSWTYGGNGTWQATNNSTTNRITFLRGLNEDGIIGAAWCNMQPALSTTAIVGIGLDSTTVPGGTMMASSGLGVSNRSMGSAMYNGVPGLGLHFITGLETVNSASAATWEGDTTGGGAFTQQGLTYYGYH